MRDNICWRNASELSLFCHLQGDADITDRQNSASASFGWTPIRCITDILDRSVCPTVLKRTFCIGKYNLIASVNEKTSMQHWRFKSKTQVQAFDTMIMQEEYAKEYLKLDVISKILQIFKNGSEQASAGYFSSNAILPKVTIYHFKGKLNQSCILLRPCPLPKGNPWLHQWCLYHRFETFESQHRRIAMHHLYLDTIQLWCYVDDVELWKKYTTQESVGWGENRNTVNSRCANTCGKRQELRWLRRQPKETLCTSDRWKKMC